jgi:hypothetical protein
MDFEKAVSCEDTHLTNDARTKNWSGRLSAVEMASSAEVQTWRGK